MQFKMTEHGFQTTTNYGTINISGNDEYGFRPFQLLVSSIAVCSGGVLRNILEKMRMPASTISIDVLEVKRNADEANRIEEIHLHFIIEGQHLAEDKMTKVFELTRKNCSMIQSVTPAIQVIETYELHQK